MGYQQNILTYPMQHPGGESYSIPIGASYPVQQAPGLSQANVMISPSNYQLKAAGLAQHPKEDVALPLGLYIPCLLGYSIYTRNLWLERWLLSLAKYVCTSVVC